MNPIRVPAPRLRRCPASTRPEFRASASIIAFACALVAAGSARADDTAYFVPQLLGAQYTLIQQHQDALVSPYAGPLSLKAGGDTARSHTFGAYLGVPLSERLQFYFDLEMFKGEGVSDSTGLGGLSNGDVIRSGTASLGKRPYVARQYLRYVLPLGEATSDVERAPEQLPGKQATQRLEFKLGEFAVSDDFDKNRYANSTRTQFSNWSLFNQTAWDFAANTRGYTTGLLVGLIEPGWALRYGVYQMPVEANGQVLEWPLARARGENLELTWQPQADGASLRLLVFRNIARMGLYREALAIAEAGGTVPDVRADDRDGRRKVGYAINGDLPLADNGDTGLFARYGCSDGRRESFAFTEVDRSLSVGAQLSGARWGRGADRVGIGYVVDGLARNHRDYLAAGGSGFLLGDGRLNYASERILEAYYAFQPVKFLTLSPDLQLVRNPGYNRDRGPARFAGIRAHLEY